ncbi:ABC transporter ATP-binding protein [Halosimplex amylolyticum]|uniref:ABC transporter ATP-binding protein n=1 Tax=Halosimplex amylolyticum TaxID=3396616 RepID=UPI003F57F44D
MSDADGSGSDDIFDYEAVTESEFDDEAPVLSLQNVGINFGREPLLGEVLPDTVKQRIGLDGEETVQAVDDVSLDVGENEVVALVGESGSGKTTLGKLAVALHEPTNGSVKYRGYDVWDVKNGNVDDNVYFDDIRKSLQIVHQDPSAALNPYRTIQTSLTDPLNIWFPELSAADRRARVLNLLDECGLTPAEEFADRYPHELSGGEKQRVALIRAMLVEPDLILADEPVSALDPSLRVEIMDLMLELMDIFDTSYLFISHNLEHARYLTNKADGQIAIMYMGEIVEYGPAEEVIQNPKHPYTKVLKWSTLPPHPTDAQEVLDTEIPLREFDVPDPSDRPTGCRFHDRCPKAKEICAEVNPDLIPEDANHTAGCFREDRTHEYWEDEFIDPRGEIEIPE